MSDFLHWLVEPVLHGLTWVVDAIYPSRMEGVPLAWVWLAAAFLAIGIVALVVAAYTGVAWLFHTFIGLVIASLCALCLGAFWPR